MPNAENGRFYIRHPASFMQGTLFSTLLVRGSRGFVGAV